MILAQNKTYSFVFFASGDGTNAENLWRFFSTKDFLHAQLLICDRVDAYVLERAKKYQIQSVVIEKNKMDQKNHEDLILEKLRSYHFDFILLCGYRRLLSAHFVGQFKGKIINIHPSLLPKYPGLHAYEEAFASGDELHGATVHFVDEGMDTGPVILQKSYHRESGESFESFKKRGMELEYDLYPEAILKIVNQQ